MFSQQQVDLASVRIQKAKEDYKAAISLLKNGSLNAANNRAYYAMFHSIRAVFALESIDFKSHFQVIGYFNKVYVHSGKFDSRYYKMIHNAVEARTQSDYEDYYDPSESDVRLNVGNAGEFIVAIVGYIEQVLKFEGKCLNDYED
jgi:uncharacterized protein (UPF0332 family)